MTEKNHWTDANIRSLPPTKGTDDHVVWHADLKRFGVRFMGGKPKSYIIMYYLGGRPRKMTLGKVNVISLTDAIKRARKALSNVDDNVDPALERQARRDTDIFQPLEDRLRCLLDDVADLSRSYQNTQRSLDVMRSEMNQRFDALDARFAARIDTMEELQKTMIAEMRRRLLEETAHG